MKPKTKGQLEAEICEAIIRFEKEFMGRGPLETKAYIIDDMVLVRLRNVLTQAELKLATAPGSKDGQDLLKRVRLNLLEQRRPLLEDACGKCFGSASKEPAYGHQYCHGGKGDPFLPGFPPCDSAKTSLLLIINRSMNFRLTKYGGFVFDFDNLPKQAVRDRASVGFGGLRF